MFRLILVDDEAIIRNGISQCLPWGQNGFVLAGMFEHGQQALEFIKNNPVDVVVTDINMPHMDGLTLSRILADQYPHIMVLLLTGYDDFEYARNAIKNQVREFILKPITASELKDVLDQVKVELIISREQELEQELLKEKLSQSFPLLKERFLNRLISGRLSEDNFNRRKEYFQWMDLEEYYQVSIISIPEVWNELERLTLQEHIKSIINISDEAYFNTDENLVLIFQGEDAVELENRTRNKIDNIFHFVGHLEKEQISVGCGEIVQSHEDLVYSYSGARNAVDYSRVLGLTQILSIKDVRSSEQIVPETFQKMLENLLVQLKEGKRIQTLSALDEIFSYLEKHYIKQKDAFIYYSRIHFLMYNFLQEMGLLTNEDPFFPHKPPFYSTINEAREGFKNYVIAIEKRIDIRRNDIIFSRVDKAKEIISLRFCDCKFSLQDMCNELYLSTSQFSFLFKEGTGQTFVEYLTSYRIEEAKRLLKTTDQKAYEIAENVGYQDSRYFSLIFKKQTGVTAMEYRKRLES
ncbi:MAG: response regulator [Spirochaetaceae bacterium]|jgi:two-component system response regulator YesN|nr:response regulator [Spirochaetaceae bacterium]